ncbi:MAG: STAS domain-containing protein [Planctomycetes bacterium]|nr:STAS domain-containing protein [Planctomycetota bacterium]
MEHRPASFEMVSRQESLTRVRLAGSLDTAGVEKIDKFFLAQSAGPGKPLLIEMAGVSFIASMGMGMLVNCCRQLARHHAKMVLLSPAKLVEQALRNAGLDTILILAHDEPRAMQILAEEE